MQIPLKTASDDFWPENFECEWFLVSSGKLKSEFQSGFQSVCLSVSLFSRLSASRNFVLFCQAQLEAVFLFNVNF